MTDTPHTLWMAASTRSLDEIEAMRCEAPECEIVQEFRALFNEIHRLKAILGIRVVPEPPFSDAALQSQEHLPEAWEKLAKSVRALIVAESKKGGSVRDSVDAIVQALTSDTPVQGYRTIGALIPWSTCSI